MNEQVIYNGLLMGWFVLATIIFIVLLYIVAPYGRYTRDGWGITTSSKAGWLIMESVSPLLFAVCFIVGDNVKTITLILFFIMWEAHYIHRSFIYPFSLRSKQKKMPLIVIVLGVFFNAINAYLNGRYIYSFSDGYTGGWLQDPRFIIGLVIFIGGFLINRNSDLILYNLGRETTNGYKIPSGGMYRLVSCPNYLGEILIWTGWAIATWSLAGLSFVLWTIANLAPRARAHHRWYKENFPDYPVDRKILVPGMW